VIVTFRVELFFDIEEFGFLVVLVVVSTLVLKRVSESKECDK